MKHERKIYPQLYSRIADGSKTFLHANNEPGYQMGDSILLREWNPEPLNSTDKTIKKGYTDSPPLEFSIGYIQVLDERNVILSLLGIKKKKS